MNQIGVRNGKGAKDPVTVLPIVAKHALTQHLQRVKRQHEADLARGAGWVELPWALARKDPSVCRPAGVGARRDVETPAPPMCSAPGAGRRPL